MGQNVAHLKFYFAAVGGGILFTQPHTFTQPRFGEESRVTFSEPYRHLHSFTFPEQSDINNIVDFGAAHYFL